MKRHFFHLVLAGSLLLCGAASAQATFTNIDQALKVANAKQLPVFIDFSATWCHDCHAMDAKVLNGPEWNAEQNHFVLVRSDADSVNGKAWMAKLHIPALPTYIVLNANGSERGRLMGYIPRATFYPQLDRILSGQDAFTKLEQDAAHGSVTAVAKVLRAYDERNQQQKGLRWYAKLPEATRKAVAGDAKAAMRLAIVQVDAESTELWFSKPPLSDTERARVSKECRAHALQALSGPIGLDDHFNIAGRLLGCAHNLPPSEVKILAAAQLPSLKSLYANEVPSADSGALFDTTHTLAMYYRVLGDEAAEKATYARAIAIGRKALDDGHGGFDVQRDPGMADVLSGFLSNGGHDADYIALKKAQVEADPDNYSYAGDYGQALLEQGKAAEALPFLQKASKRSEGTVSHLKITYSLAKALIALHRRPEAVKLFNAALLQAKKQFPEMTKIDVQAFHMKL